MIDFAHITMRFGASLALSDVSLALPDGTVLAVCGENGAGKSTLMNILAGVIPHGAYEGDVQIGGVTSTFSRPADAERAGIALLPQELSYYPELSVAENVMGARLPSRLGLFRRNQVSRVARDLCRQVELSVPVETPMRLLETGERQLVCIARALSLDPTILILDEPTAALPTPSAERLFAVIRGMARRGASVLYISHHLNEVLDLADQVAVLRNGSLTMPPREHPTMPELIEAMVGRELKQLRAKTHTPPGSVRTAALDARVRRVRTGTSTVLEEVRVEVHPGQVVGIAGLTGSGREVLLGVLAGAVSGHVEGDMKIDGHPASLGSSPKKMRELGVLYVPDDRRADGLIGLGTVTQNVLLGNEGISARLGVRRPREELSLVERILADYAVQPVDGRRSIASLSGGNQQKVMLARAGVRRPITILLAEPTRGVDVGARGRIYELIETAASGGTAIVISSSDAAEIAHLCDHVLVLSKGRVVRTLQGAAITEEAVLGAVNTAVEDEARGLGETQTGP